MQRLFCRASTKTSVAPIVSPLKPCTLGIDPRFRFARQFSPMNTEELPLFPLARWELPPHLDSEPLVAPATARWHGELWGETTNWLVRVVRDKHIGRVFICAEERIEEAKWDLYMMPHKNIESREDWTAALDDYIKAGHSPLYRTFYLKDETADWTLSFDTYGEHHLMVQGQKEQAGERIDSNASIQINWPFAFFSATSAQIETEVTHAWSDEASNLFFARKWLLLSEDEKNGEILSWKRGDRRELKEAMEYIWRVFAPHVKEGSTYWAFDPKDNQFGYNHFPDDISDDEVGEPSALHLWGQGLLEVFGPIWSKDLVNQHPCTSKAHSRMESYFFVGTTERTFHEQLEAARTLSEWLDEREAQGELKADTLAALRETLR